MEPEVNVSSEPVGILLSAPAGVGLIRFSGRFSYVG